MKITVDKLLHADYSARLFFALHELKRFVLHWLFTKIHRLEARMMGVKIGRNVSFNGHITLDRFKYSLISIGDDCVFNSSSAFNPRGISQCILKTCTDYAKIIIGDNCGFSGVTIVCHDEIRIGKNVTIGANVKIGDNDDHSAITHTLDKPVIIGDNVFIGMGCFILKGVKIGENAIIGAGSIVTRDMPANSICAGVPCKVLKDSRS